jgi:hypothetical protein
MPPGLALDCIMRLHHGRHQPRDIGQGRIEQDEIRRHFFYRPQSSSASRFTAGASGFLNFSQSFDRPVVGSFECGRVVRDVLQFRLHP